MHIFRARYPYASTQKNILRRTYLAVSVATFEVSINFDVDVDETLDNIANRTVSLSIDADLSELSSAQIDAVKSMLFNISAAQNQSNIKTTNESILLDIDLDYSVLNGLLTVASIDFDTSLNFNILNQLAAESNITLGTDLNFNVLNQLILESNITLGTDLSFNIVSQLAANVGIVFNTNLDFSFEVSGAGIVEGSVTFLANMSQIQSNTITIEKAFTLIMDLAAQYNTQLDKNEVLTLLIQVAQSQIAQRGIPADRAFDIQLSQTQSNLATRIGLLTFNAALTQAIETQLDYNLFINLATTLALAPSTAGEVLGSVSFDVSIGQQEVITKDISEAIALALQVDYETDIYLVARGDISFTTQMEQLRELQMLGQAGITFGHLLGLASLGSAVFGEDITFSTIQDISIDGFVLQFTITTPGNRILIVYLEDRTVTIDGGDRTIQIVR